MGNDQGSLIRQGSWWESVTDHPDRTKRKMKFSISSWNLQASFSWEVSAYQKSAGNTMWQRGKNLEGFWSMWKRTAWHSWWGNQLGKVPTGPAVCQQKRAGGRSGCWRPCWAWNDSFWSSEKGPSRAVALHCQETNFGLFRTLVDRSSWEVVLKGKKGKGVQEGWAPLKKEIFRPRIRPFLCAEGQASQEGWSGRNRELWLEPGGSKESLCSLEDGMGNSGKLQECQEVMQVKEEMGCCVQDNSVWDFRRKKDFSF